MIIDFNGHLVKKGNILHMFVGVKQIIFSNDDLCFNIVDVIPIYEFNCLIFKAKDPRCKEFDFLVIVLEFCLLVNNKKLVFQFIKINESSKFFSLMLKLKTEKILHENIVNDIPPCFSNEIIQELRAKKLDEVERRIS